MNSRQLLKIGVPEYCLKTAMTAIQQAVASEKIRGKEVKELVKQVVAQPEDFLEDAAFGALAAELVDENTEEVIEPIDYQTWGKDGIDEVRSLRWSWRVTFRRPTVQH